MHKTTSFSVRGASTNVPRVACVGGALIDRKYTTLAEVLFDSSNPARMTTHFGGVARNVAENLARLDVSASLLARIGDDAGGRALRAHASGLGIDTNGVESMANTTTDEYAAIVHPDGSLVLGVNDARVVESIDIEYLERHSALFNAVDWVFLDANLPAESIAWLRAQRRTRAFKLAADGVSEAKVQRLGRAFDVDLLFVKRAHAHAYLGADADASPDNLARELRKRGAECVVLTLGAQGCIVASGSGVARVPAVNAAPIDATGAGDALIAATLYRLLHGDTPETAVALGTLLAALTIESSASVVPQLTPAFLISQGHRLLR
jgi:pseudouridine kinase